jgi:cob(I)alamin adenosyltransferase
MPKLTKIYTKTGDDGTTALGTTRRVLKNDLRIEAYGTVDELNSFVGLVLAHGASSKLTPILTSIQNELFHLGSDLAYPEDDKKQFEVPRIEMRHIEQLENSIDKFNKEVGPLENFILPGGSISAATLHLCRTICRRCERICVELAQTENINPLSVQYLNRLSDAFFVYARFENFVNKVQEPLWDSKA